MDLPINNDSNLSHNMTSINYDETHISGSWRHSQKPANYSEDQAGAANSQLGLLKSPRNWKPRSSISLVPASYSPSEIPMSPARYSSPVIIAASSEYTTPSPPIEDATITAEAAADNSTTLRIWPKPVLDCINRTIEGPVYPTSAGSVNTGNSVKMLVPSTITRHDRSQKHIAILGASDNQENNPVTKNLPSKNEPSDIIGIRSPNETGNINYDPSTASPESSGKSNSDSSGGSSASNSISISISKESENHSSEASKSQPRIVPRIITPDGTSINLSTPPTTPRLQHRSFNFSQPSVWSNNLTQILERFGSKNYWNNTQHGRQTYSDQESSQSHLRHDAQRSNYEEYNMTNRNESDGYRYQNPSADVTRAEEAQGNRIGNISLPQFGVMGVPIHGYRSDSIASDGKGVWLGEEEETPGAFFSQTRWSYLLCTRKGLIKSFKHSTTTIFGLLIIIAIGITASGKFRDRDLVSDFIPKSLENTIMEAQIVVIKDFDRHQQSKRALQRNSEPYSPALVEPSPLSKLQTVAKIPIWTGSIESRCFHRECDLEDFGEEYFAFLNPESFGIALSQNWPSLCNSCIEISLNRFVYKTRARVLGDLLSCPADSSSAQMLNTASLTMTSMLSRPTATASITTTNLTAFQPSTSTIFKHSTTSAPTPVTSSVFHIKQLKHTKQPSISRSAVHAPDPTSVVNSTAGRHPTDDPITPFKQHSQQRQQKQSKQHTTEYSLRATPTNHKVNRIQKRQDITSEPGSHSLTALGIEVTKLPYLIVDPTTFSNLTAYETQEELQNLSYLRVHFRFVLCDS